MKIKIKPIYFLFIVIFFALLFIIVLFERRSSESNIHSVWDALWYSIVTLTTVGYGDNYPVTIGGKILGLFFIFSSLGLLGFLFGSANNLIQSNMEKKKEGFYGTKLTEHFVIIGWDNFARYVAEQIILAGNKLALVTDNRDDVDTINKLFPGKNIFVLYTDLNNYAEYNKANINQSRSVFVNLPDDSKSLVFVINMKKHYQNIDYIISLQNAELKETFQSVGVKHVLGKNEIASKLVASFIFEPDVADFTEDLMATSVDENDFDIQQYKVVEGNPFANSNYLDAFVQLKKDYDCILLGIVKIKNGERVLLKNPRTETTIEKDDFMLLISNGLTKKKIEESFLISEGYYQ